MFFGEIICDLEWYNSVEGQVGQPKVNVESICDKTGIKIQILVYGSDTKVDHLRVLMHTESIDEANDCSNYNISFWTNKLGVSTGLFTGKPITGEKFGSSIMFVLGEGDGSNNKMSIKPELLHSAIDYSILAESMVNWHYNAAPYLFYFNRFVDIRLTLDDRWSNGYKLIEWHFEKGGWKLSSNKEWRKYLELYRKDIEPHLTQPNQQLSGWFEQTRAITAHASLDKRTTEERLAKPGNALDWSFPILNKIVIELMNMPDVSKGRFKILTN